MAMVCARITNVVRGIVGIETTAMPHEFMPLWYPQEGKGAEPVQQTVEEMVQVVRSIAKSAKNRGQLKKRIEK
jgi:hypothetical protein